MKDLAFCIWPCRKGRILRGGNLAQDDKSVLFGFCIWLLMSPAGGGKDRGPARARGRMHLAFTFCPTDSPPASAPLSFLL